MGYEELIHELIRSAERKKEEILNRAREAAEQTIARAKEKENGLEREFQAALAQEAERERRIRMNRAQIEARAVMLQARVSLMEEVFARLEDRLRRIAGEKDYPRLVEKLYQEILPEIPDGNITVRADSKATAAVKSLLGKRRVRFEPLPEEEIGGLEVLDEAGGIRIRNTLKARLLKARPQLMVEINRWLANHD